MRDDNLATLNFSQLLNYGGRPNIKNVYEPPLSCSGYCVDCEKSGDVFENSGDYFDQMSHGCDSSDFEALLGPLTNRGNSFPIVFLLENPGGDHGNGEIIHYQGYKKQPPVNHYYWTPNINEWPNCSDELPHLYGPYFAYLMNKHGLSNVYITNVTKCNTLSTNNKSYNSQKATEICTKKFLKKEMDIFSPKYIFCFGQKAYKHLKTNLPEYYESSKCVCLYHPAARKSRDEIVSKNDDEISNIIKNR